MLASLKNIAPLIIYVAALLCCVMAASGRTFRPFLFLTFLLPLRNVVERLTVFPLGKDINDLLIACLILGIFINKMRHRDKFKNGSSLQGIAWVLIIYTYCSLLKGYMTLGYFTPFDFSDDRVQDWKNYVLLAVFFFLTMNVVKTRRQVKEVIFVMGAALLIMDYYTINQISWYHALLSRDKINATFVFLGPNEVAAFYNQITIVLLSGFLSIKNKFQRLGLFVLIMLNTYCILFLYSRGAYLGMVVGLTLLFLIKRNFLFVPLVFLILFWQSLLPDQVIERIEMTRDVYGQLESSAGNRILVWQQAIDLWKQEPFLGIGFGVFRRMGFVLGDTHNIYLKVLVEQGIIGLAIFVILVWKMMSMGWRLYRRGKDDLSEALGLGFSLAVIVAMVNNTFGDRWTYLEMGGYLWIFAGLVGRMILINREESQNKKIPPDGNGKGRTHKYRSYGQRLSRNYVRGVPLLDAK